MFVGSEGPKTARLAIVGEKPGRDEVHQGRPFVGITGQELRHVLRKLNVQPEQVYITNAVKHVNDFNNPTPEEIAKEQPSLFRELLQLPFLNCIVPVGGAALASLSNFHYDKILSRRGSILQSVIGKKMVPTFHPSYYLRIGDFKLREVLKFDIGRALEESQTPLYAIPQRTYKIAETIEDVRSIRNSLKGAKYIAFDIENRRTIPHWIKCISFAKVPDTGYCIPIMHGPLDHYNHHWSLQEEKEVWRIIQEILMQEETCYITQNGQHDCGILWQHGIITPFMDKGMDTCYMHRTRMPVRESKKKEVICAKLEFIVSKHTREPYYKDESGFGDAEPIPDEQFWIYNIKDSVCTLEAALDLKQEMQEYNMWDCYMEEVQSLFPIVMEASQTGIKVDRTRMQEVRSILEGEIKEANDRIQSVLGWVPNTKSPIEMEKFLTQEGIPFDRTKTGRPAMDKDALNRYLNKAEGRSRDIVSDMLYLNTKRTLLSGFTSLALDSNDFYHFSLKLAATVTLRLASEGAEEGGPQLQNIPKYARQLFIPDDNESEFTECDLKQAEQRLCAWQSNDLLLIEAFSKGIDPYSAKGCVLYKGWKERTLPPLDMIKSISKVCPECVKYGHESCKHSERYNAKQTSLARNYKMGARKYCTLRRQEGIFIPEYEAKNLLELIASEDLKNWQASVAHSLEQSAWLDTVMQGRREFYGIIDEDMIREALSWKCQRPVAQITSRAMVRLYKMFQELPRPRPRIVTQTHDSVLTSHKKEQRSFVVECMKKAFDQSMMINGMELTIPLEIMHGPDWGHLEEEK